MVPRQGVVPARFIDVGRGRRRRGVPGAAVLSLRDHFDSLVPLLHNFHAIVLHEEILCREFYDDLLVAKDHIAERLRLVDSPLRPKALSLRTTASTAPADLVRRDLETPLDEALERCVKNLGDLERLVRPAATRLDFLDDKDWRTARELLSRTINAARAATGSRPGAAVVGVGPFGGSRRRRRPGPRRAARADAGRGPARTRSTRGTVALVDTGPLVLDYKTKRAKTGGRAVTFVYLSRPIDLRTFVQQQPRPRR